MCNIPTRVQELLTHQLDALNIAHDLEVEVTRRITLARQIAEEDIRKLVESARVEAMRILNEAKSEVSQLQSSLE